MRMRIRAAALLLAACLLIALAPAGALADRVFYPGSEDVKLLEDYLSGSGSVTEAQALEALGRIKERLMHSVFDIEVIRDPGFPAAQDGGVTDYIINRRSKRFHRPGCKGVAQVSPEHYAAYHGTRDELIKMGYVPCGNCEP